MIEYMALLHNTLGARTDADFERLAGLRRMQRIALILLAAMAVIFAVSFALQDTYPWLTFVRAAAEGGMVGGLADWFAITALFRKPLGLPIPHTNLISAKKDEIGEGLGSFIEENFLADDVIHNKLSEISGARRAGEWIAKPANARKIDDLIAQSATAALTVLNDNDVQELLETLIKRHLIDSDWSPVAGRVVDEFASEGYQNTVIDIAADHFDDWLENHPEAFNGFVSRRTPGWLPSFVDKFVDTRLHSEVLKFVRDVRQNPDHPFRSTVDEFLHDFATDLQHEPVLQEQVHSLAQDVFESPRVRTLTTNMWDRVREVLLEQFANSNSEIRARIVQVLADFGVQLQHDRTLQFKIDVWVMQVVEHLVHTYRHDLAGVVIDTVQKWDSQEAAQKIELQIGKDLQFIRMNGTVVGALAGLTITVIAHVITALT